MHIILAVLVYYRELKELINPQLRALEKKKKITKPPAFARAPKTNQIINFGARPVQSIRVFCACAQNQSSNQLWGALTLITRQHAAPSPLFIAWGSPPSSFVYQLTTSPSLLSRQGPTHPFNPFCAWWPRGAASGLAVDIWSHCRQAD